VSHEQSSIREAWFKSSFSGGSGGECVEVRNAQSSILVRDSKNADGSRLRLSSSTWRAFVRTIK
jgi:hypothetical protein